MISKPFQRHWILAAALCWLGAHEAFAKTQDDYKLRVDKVDDEYIIQLGWLNEGKKDPIELRGADGRYKLKLPIPYRLEIEDAKLEMVYTNSISLQPRSQLAVTLNERILAQLPIRAEQPDNAARIALPVASLNAPGYSDLGFRASHHYTYECEDPSAPELYSQVDATQSLLRIKTRRLPIESSLAKLSQVFDGKLWLDRYDMELVVPSGSLARDASMREAAAQASQAIANKFVFLPVTVNVTETGGMARAPESDPQARFPGLNLPGGSWDVVLMGTRDELASVASPAMLSRIREGYLGLFPSDQDPTRAVLVVSGLNSAQVLQAAKVLNLNDIALPDRPEVSISELTMDEGYRRTQPTQVESGWTSFANLGFKTTTMRGMYPAVARLEFWGFREMFDPNTPYVEAELNFAYGAGFDKKSSLNILLNGDFVQALPLQQKGGDQLWHASVRIPTMSVRPGNNVMTFVPTMIGEDVGGKCQPIFTDHLFVSVFEDSRIELPPLSDYMAFPDLTLMTRIGLPYTRFADGMHTGVMITDMRPANLSSAFTLIAKLRQVHKAPLTALRFVSAQDDLSTLDGLIVVGDIGSLPNSVLKELSAFLPGQRWQTLQVGTIRETDVGHGAKRWIDQPLTPFAELSHVENPATARATFSEGLGESTGIVQYMSQDFDMPITVLTAATPDRLHAGAFRLAEHETWSALAGAATLWSTDGEAIAQAFPVAHDFVGEAPAANPISFILSDRPWLSVLVAFLVVLFVATVTWWLLRARERNMKLDE